MKPTYKQYALKVAKELRYKDEVIAKIEAAKTDTEIERILHDARRELFERGFKK